MAADDYTSGELLYDDALRYLIDAGMPPDLAKFKIELLDVILHCDIDGAPWQIKLPGKKFWESVPVAHRPPEGATNERHTVLKEAVEQALQQWRAAVRKYYERPVATGVAHQWPFSYQAPPQPPQRIAITDMVPVKAATNSTSEAATPAPSAPAEPDRQDNIDPALANAIRERWKNGERPGENVAWKVFQEHLINDCGASRPAVVEGKKTEVVRRGFGLRQIQRAVITLKESKFLV
jgi:hypothetical protein